MVWINSGLYYLILVKAYRPQLFTNKRLLNNFFVAKKIKKFKGLVIFLQLNFQR